MRSFLRLLGRCLLVAILVFLLCYTHAQVYFVGYEAGMKQAVKQFNKS